MHTFLFLSRCWIDSKGAQGAPQECYVRNLQEIIVVNICKNLQECRPLAKIYSCAKLKGFEYATILSACDLKPANQFSTHLAIIQGKDSGTTETKNKDSEVLIATTTRAALPTCADFGNMHAPHNNLFTVLNKKKAIKYANNSLTAISHWPNLSAWTPHTLLSYKMNEKASTQKNPKNPTNEQLL